MSWWEALILGVVQGATEFLPVSSSGHLVVTQALLGLEIPGISYEIALHVATLFSVCLVYRQRLADLARGLLRREGPALRYLAALVVATIPAGLVGVFLEDQISAAFESPQVVGFALLLTGVLLWSTKGRMQERERRPPTQGQAVAMGFAQAFAIIPGISRSGSTVVAGLWGGVDAEEAAAFSFLMAIPAILGAAVLKLPELQAEGSAGVGAVALLVGAAAAAVTGVLAIRTFVAMLRNRSFHRFALYLWPAGLFVLLYVARR